jgi:MinD-like ATPase involved in chromosome partitioning or flagellar assembly
MTRIIGIISGKGGVGKTTMALNIAAALSKHYGKRTTLVDCNLTTSHIGLHLGNYHYPKTLNHVLRGEARMEEVVYDFEHGMSLIPASISIRDLDGIDVIHLKDRVRELCGTKDFILLDSAPGMGREAMGALRAVDEVIMVGNPNIMSITDIMRCNEVCQELDVKPIGIILNMVNKDKYDISRQEIERLTGLAVMAEIPYHHNLRKSMTLRAPLVSVMPNDKVSKQIIKMSAILAQMPMPLSGRFSRFRRALRF